MSADHSAGPPSTSPDSLPTLAPTRPPGPDDSATLAPPPDDAGTLSRVPPWPGSQNGEPPPAVPGYEILGELGRGGMGVVYKARQVGLDRRCALKMILAGGHAGSAERARFRTEAEAIARLQHPNIVQIYEVGEHQGLPYFSLEFCEGGSLASKLDGTPLPPPRAAALVEALARGVQAAHDKGVVHRDLKPANVLLTSDDTPRITDFGLAKKLDDEGQTQSGSILGTPSYMAPEQAGGKTGDVGPAADVYALGAILYECLTGRPPFKAATPLDTVLQVVSEEPVPPRRLQPKVPRDLETICLKCLHKQPGKRYGSARELEEDLRHFQAGEPIRARPTGAWERGLKWARRRPALAGLSAVTLIAAVGLVVGGLWYNARLSVERDAATRARDEAQSARDDADQQRVHAEQAEALARRHAHAAQVLLTQHAWEDGQTHRARELLQGLRPRRRDEADLRGFEWGYLERLCQGDLFTYRGHEGVCYEAAFSPDGRRVASVGVAGRDATGKIIEPGKVKGWEPATGREVFTCTGHRADVASVAFSPDGRWIASGGGLAVAPMNQGEVKLWNADTGKLVRTLGGSSLLGLFGGGHSHMVFSVVFSPDSRRLASAGVDSVIRLWDVSTGKLLRQIKGHKDGIRRLAFSPDGKRLASAGWDTTVRVWDVPSGKALHTLKGHGALVLGLSFHPKGRFLASAGFDKLVRIWDIDTGKEVRALPGSRGWISTVVYSPDGRRLAAGGGDPLVRVWDPGSAAELDAYRGRDNGVNTLAYSQDGRYLAAASSDGAVTVWETAASPRAVQTFEGHTALAFVADGSFVAGRKDGTLAVHGLKPGEKPRTFKGHTRTVNDVAISPDGRWLASGSDDETARVWDLAAGRQRHLLSGHKGDVAAVAFSPDSRRLVSGGKDRTLRFWDVADGRLLNSVRDTQQAFNAIAFSPGGRLLATASIRDAVVYLRDADSGQVVRTLAGHQLGIAAVAFSPDGRRLASGSFDGTLKVWDPASGRIVLDLRGRSGQVGGVAFSPDGQRLAAGLGQLNSGNAGKIQLWDAVTGQELLELPGVGDIFVQVAFSPDGQRLAAASENIASSERSLLVWDGRRPAVPDTSRWRVLFRDDFRQGKLEEHWVAGGGWSVQDGRARGRLEPVVYQKIRIPNASLTAKQKLPSTVEVRFDCWTSSEMNVYATFTESGGHQGAQAWLLGVPTHMRMRGAALVWQGGLLHFPMLASNPHLAVEPRTPYRVRVLRQPRRLTLFVNDVEVTSAVVPLLETPKLTLGGMVGPLGSELFLEHVEVRVPDGKPE